MVSTDYGCPARSLASLAFSLPRTADKLEECGLAPLRHFHSEGTTNPENWVQGNFFSSDSFCLKSLPQQVVIPEGALDLGLVRGQAKFHCTDRLRGRRNFPLRHGSVLLGCFCILTFHNLHRTKVLERTSGGFIILLPLLEPSQFLGSCLSPPRRAIMTEAPHALRTRRRQVFESRQLQPLVQSKPPQPMTKYCRIAVERDTKTELGPGLAASHWSEGPGFRAVPAR